MSDTYFRPSRHSTAAEACSVKFFWRAIRPCTRLAPSSHSLVLPIGRQRSRRSIPARAGRVTSTVRQREVRRGLAGPVVTVHRDAKAAGVLADAGRDKPPVPSVRQRRNRSAVGEGHAAELQHRRVRLSAVQGAWH